GIRSFGEEFVTEVELAARFREFGLKTYLDRLKASSTAAAAADMFRVLASPKFMASEVLAEGAVRELEAARVRVPPQVPEIGGKLMLDQAGVAKVSGRYGDPRAGEGIDRLTTTRPEIKENTRLIRIITLSGAIPELDLVSRLVGNSDIAKFAADLVTQARATGGSAKVKTFVLQKLQELNR
ncbi:MAG TPA: hypothetical protein VFV34_07915, partial [Blastocatellia bacterium]|nr:hypothetical protein [Blastocatellia bacterium]